MTKDEALRLALEVLQDLEDTQSYWWQEVDEVTLKQMEPAITAIKAALEAKDEPEYYGLTKDHLWMSISKEHYDRLKPEFRMACYTTPPQRTWVGLTDEEVKNIVWNLPY
jgi:hypothetical protein